MPDDPKEKPTTPTPAPEVLPIPPQQTPDDVRLDRLERYYKDAMDRVFKVLGWILVVVAVIVAIIAGIIPVTAEWQREKTNKIQMDALKEELKSHTIKMLEATKTELESQNKTMKAELTRDLTKARRSAYFVNSSSFGLNSQMMAAAMYRIAVVRESIELNDVEEAKNSLDTAYLYLKESWQHDDPLWKKEFLPDFFVLIDDVKTKLSDADFPKECIKKIAEIETLAKSMVQIKPAPPAKTPENPND